MRRLNRLEKAVGGDSLVHRWRGRPQGFGLQPPCPVIAECQHPCGPPLSISSREAHPGQESLTALPISLSVPAFGTTRLAPEPRRGIKGPGALEAALGAELGSPFASQELPQESQDGSGRRWLVRNDIQTVDDVVDCEGTHAERFRAIYFGFISEQPVRNEGNVKLGRRHERIHPWRTDSRHYELAASSGHTRFRVWQRHKVSSSTWRIDRKKATIRVSSQLAQEPRRRNAVIRLQSSDQVQKFTKSLILTSLRPRRLIAGPQERAQQLPEVFRVRRLPPGQKCESLVANRRSGYVEARRAQYVVGWKTPLDMSNQMGIVMRQKPLRRTRRNATHRGEREEPTPRSQGGPRRYS